MRDYAETGLLAVDWANTLDPALRDPERVPDVAALRRFLEECGIAGDPTERDLAAFRALRDRLRRALAADDPADLAEGLSEIGRGLLATPVLERDAAGSWRLAAKAPEGSPLIDRMAVTGLDQLAAVIAVHGPERIGTCAASPCEDVFVDTTRNATRRFCSARCANRHHAAEHRARQRKRRATPTAE